MSLGHIDKCRVSFYEVWHTNKGTYSEQQNTEEYRNKDQALAALPGQLRERNGRTRRTVYAVLTELLVDDSGEITPRRQRFYLHNGELKEGAKLRGGFSK